MKKRVFYALYATCLVCTVAFGGMLQASPIPCAAAGSAPPFVPVSYSAALGDSLVICSAAPGETASLSFGVLATYSVPVISTDALLVINEPVAVEVGTNAFPATQTGVNTLKWGDILLPIGPDQPGVLRFTGVRVDASSFAGVPPGPVPPSITMLITFAGEGELPSLVNPTQIVAFVDTSSTITPEPATAWLAACGGLLAACWRITRRRTA